MAELQVYFGRGEDQWIEGMLDSEFSDMVGKMLEASTVILEAEVKRGIKDILKDKGRNELINSVSPWKKPVKTATGAYMHGVCFKGSPKKKSRWVQHTYEHRTSKGQGYTTYERNTSYNDIAWWLEYGNAHMSAKPFMAHASNRAYFKVIENCQKIFDQTVGIK